MSGDQMLAGAAALAALLRQWRENVLPHQAFADPPCSRLSTALLDPAASVLDRVVLLRHVLRQESLRRRSTVHVRIESAHAAIARSVGLAVQPLDAAEIEVSANPWKPTWLDGGRHSVDEGAMAAEDRRFRGEAGPRADPMLQAVGIDTYRSAAQRAAIRGAASMPPGELLVIDLPTGEGKSTVFRVLAHAGFSANPSGIAPGIVVVVVPTVALALDHERTCGGSDAAPMAYVGGRDARNELIRRAVAGGTQRLIFASPEAVVQSLRGPLSRCAREGRLGAVVIDEAHLIDGWGTGFRTEFQTLAGVLNAWRNDAPVSTTFRTIFLSATFDEASVQTLQDLFAPGRQVPLISGARVRAEPEYWIAEPADHTVRAARVEEALSRAPRPAILYVTKISDADRWYDRLCACGYRRLDKMHGRTDASSREEVLRRWNDESVDIIVATSAFGLGIDYPHVRTVMHACLPETLNRFYQEVGRGGRDGRTSLSILVPAFGDDDVARSLSAKKVITVERGLTRWKAMFGHPASVCEAHPFYKVPLDIPPGHEMADIDLVGERSTDWNQRTLALMARSGLIRLLGAEYVDQDEGNGPRQFERIEIRDEQHLSLQSWNARVEPTRADIAARAARAFGQLREFTRGNSCPARLVASLYGTRDRQVALVCSGCRVCRADPSAKLPEGTVPYASSPWPMQGALAPAMENIWGSKHWAVVTYPGTEPDGRTLRDLMEAVRRLDQYGIRIWIDVGAPPSWLRNAATRTISGKTWVMESTDTWAPMLWPNGARIIVCGRTEVPSPQIAAFGATRAPCLLFIPDQSADPTQTNREFVSVLPTATYTFHSFLNVILQ